MAVRLFGSGSTGLVDSTFLTTSLNTGTTQMGRLLTVALAWWDPGLLGATLSSLYCVDSGGTQFPLTLWSNHDSGTNHNEIWYLVAPPTGVGREVSANFTDLITGAMRVCAWTGADQLDPLSAAVKDANTTDTPSITVPSYNRRDAMTDCLGIVQGTTVATRTVTGTNQNLDYNVDLSYDVNTNYSFTASRVAEHGALGSGDGTLSYSLSAAKSWRMQAVAVRHMRLGAAMQQYQRGKP